MATKTPDEMIAQGEADQEARRNRVEWGVWRFDSKLVELVYEEKGSRVYSVDLADINSCADLMSWVFQIHNTIWATPHIVHDLLSALTDLLYAQNNYCGGGEELGGNAINILRKSGRIDDNAIALLNTRLGRK